MFTLKVTPLYNFLVNISYKFNHLKCDIEVFKLPIKKGDEASNI